MKVRILILLSLFSLHVIAQKTANDSIIELSEVTISSTRLGDCSAGLIVDKFDTLSLTINRFSDLSDLISSQSALYIKSYGQGSLATVSFRGTSANHTGVYWNGFKINPPNIGMMDLSLIPVFFFESVEVQHGGASSLFGSGNIGGSIHVNNKPVFQKQKYLDLGLSAGSFSNYSGNLKFVVSNNKWSSKTGVLLRNALNDFPYNNIGKIDNPIEKNENAELLRYGVIEELYGKLANNQIINATVWYQYSKREIPSSMVMNTSMAFQTDESVRSSFQWKKYFPKGSVMSRIAYMNEKLHYVDSLIDINSQINTQSVISELEGNRYFGKSTKINLGVNFTLHHADISEYKGAKEQREVAVFLMINHKIPKIGWKVALNLRKGFVDEYQVPFSPSLGLEGKVWRFIHGKINISKNFRTPTLNDRFWVPGGNENLKPEEGWNQEATLIFRIYDKVEKKPVEIAVTYYNSVIDNWIMWYPQQSYWTPQNIQKVWARGVEMKANAGFKYNKFKCNLLAAYTYSISTNEKKISSKDISYKKQLIYVPEYKYFIQIKLKYKTIDMIYHQDFTGRRYVLVDNSKYLDEYSLGNLKLLKTFDFKKKELQFQVGVNNIWNKEYQAIWYRPMPGRSFSVTVVFKLK